MKEFKFKEDFVDSKVCSTRLDSIHGNRGANMEQLACQYGYEEDQDEVYAIKKIESLTKEKTIYHVDKGGFALNDFFKLHKDEAEIVCDNLFRLSFEQSVNFYFYDEWAAHGYSGHGYFEVYSNVRRVVLPPKNIVKKSTTDRIYVVTSDNGDYYVLPKLYYPQSVKDLLMWLKKTKKVKFKAAGVWNKDEALYEKDWDGTIRDHLKYSFGVWTGCYSYIPFKNIQNLDQLEEYRKWLVDDFKPLIIDEFKRGIRYGSPSDSDFTFVTNDVDLTQDTVDEFISLQNDRFKIEW